MIEKICGVINMKKGNLSNLIFMCAVWLFLVLCLVRTVLLPKDICVEENRYANRITRPTAASVMDGSFQSGAEAAFSDQAIGAGETRTGYNFISAKVTDGLLGGLYAANRDRYIRISDNISLFGGDYLVYDTRVLEDMAPLLDATADNINAFAAAHPDVPLYVYYIEKDTDINFETGEKVGASDRLTEELELPAGNTGIFRINSFDDYARRFYRTDHHWNAFGSYQGYREVLDLLGGGEPLEPVGTVTLDKPLSGSKAVECGGGGVRTEDFTAFRFEYPPMKIMINRAQASDYGAQEQYFGGGGDAGLSYGSFYGADYGEIVFDTGNGGENLLVLGESHDNAILKLLASHFGRTYSVDLRYYQVQTGEEFNAYDYIERNGIDKVLLIGSIGFYLSDEPLL